MDFVAIDFETANASRASACSIGLVKVLGGEKVDSFYSLIKPPSGLDSFAPVNVAIHGITQEDVHSAPTFEQLWAQVQAFVENLALVAHNAPFDIGVLRESCRVYGIVPNPTYYFCTIVLARPQIDLLSYSLPFVAEAVGLSEFEHHNALDDANAAADIAIKLLQISGKDTLGELADLHHIRPGFFDSKGSSGTNRIQRGKAVSYKRDELNELEAQIDVDSLDSTHPCFGKEFIFTGALSYMNRKDAQEAVIKVGGKSGSSVTKKTNYLVYGAQDASVLRPGAKFSEKYLKALSERERRQDIEVIDEITFLGMLDY